MKDYSKSTLRNRSAKRSIFEGGFTSVSSGVGESYIVPFALALKANNLHISFFSSFVGLIGSVSRVFGSNLMYHYSRKRIIVTSIFLQSLLWLLIASIGLLLYFGNLSSLIAIYLLLGFYTLYAMLGSIEGPSWFSLMGDLIDEKGRGKYFSHRNRITIIIGVSSTFIASFFLDYFEAAGFLILAFTTLFAIAAIARSISAHIFNSLYEPSISFRKDTYFSFWQYLIKSPYNNVGRFTLFVSLINIATQFAGPFFAVYMLSELQFSYVTFSVVILSAGIFSILSMPLWGEISDKYGNKVLLTIGSVLIPIAPFLWLFSTSPVFIIAGPQLFGALGWGAFHLASGNFLYDAVTKQRRGLVISYSGIINGMGIFIGALLGGLYSHYVTSPLFGLNVFLSIFLISGIARIFIILIMIPLIKEVRPPSDRPPLSVLSAIHLLSSRPIHSLFRGIRNGIHSFHHLNNWGSKPPVSKKR